MARVTIEDCLEKVDDRFELVAIAGQRARNIASGAPLTIERKGEKDTVISLREIAEATVLIEDLKKDLIKSHQKEKEAVEEFVLPANQNDSTEIDAEEADIAAAIAEASEANLAQEEEEMEGFSTGELSGENVEAND
jgi:DNA-directed RNA polymerase subunit omega